MMLSWRILSFSTLMVVLSACSFSLVADVTPLPGYQSLNQTTREAASGLLYPLAPPDPTKGEAIFVEECSPCHGQTGMGDGLNSASLPVPVVVIGDQETTRQAIPSEWFREIFHGNLERSMPSFKLLTDRQRWDVVAYALSLNVSEQDLAHGSQLYKENCAGCHGIHGDGKGSDAANLDVPGFTAQENMAMISNADFYQVITNGSGMEMPSFIDRLSMVERWEVANYIRSLSFSPTVSRESASSNYYLPQTDSITRSTPATALPGLAVTHMSGVIRGKVASASGRQLPAGLAITLHAFDQMQEVYTITTTLMENGAYFFDGVEMPVARGFMTSVIFNDVEYYSDAVVVEESQQAIELSLEVYETTTDTTILLVDRLHYFFELLPDEYSQAEDRTMRVVELYVISNPGTKTLIAPQRDQPVVSFHLPSGASNLELQNGNLDERYLRTSDGFGDTTPVRPGAGSYQVMFSYTVPYSSEFSLSWPVRFPIKALVILVSGNGIAVEGDGIRDVGMRDIQGMQYHVYEGNSFSPGQELALSITDQPLSKRLALSTGSGSNLVIGLVALAASLAFAAMWILRRNQNEKPRTKKKQERSIKPAVENPETIMDTILALDDLYRGGSLPEDAYIQRRLELKARLREVMGG
jgi:mono/diheme cytochrome c family protein